MRLIVASGKQGAGKTYLIQQLAVFGPVGLKVKVIKFADPLYQLQDLIYDHVKLTKPKTKDRELLQWLGTEWGRKKDENIWVNLWAEQVGRAREEGYDVVITDDMRFPNEYKKACELEAIKIRIDAARDVRAKRIELINEAHPSETALDSGFFFDYILYSCVDQATNDLQAQQIFQEVFNARS